MSRVGSGRVGSGRVGYVRVGSRSVFHPTRPDPQGLTPPENRPGIFREGRGERMWDGGIGGGWGA